MVNDISQEIIEAKQKLNVLERLMANPAISGHDKIYNALIELDLVVQDMFIKWEGK
jgi:hypothetical protein